MLVSLEDIWVQIYFRRSDGREMSLGELPTARVLQSGETVPAEEIILGMPDGREVETLVNAAPIYSESGEIESVVVAVQDLTPLEDKERLRAEFLGLVSEALGVPLTTIKGSVASLQDTTNFQDTTESLQLLRIIDHQADIMRVQINSLVELTHIEAGTLPVSPESSELHVLVDDASEDFSRGHPGYIIEKSLPADLPAVMVDKQRIFLVLRNLLYGAARYSPESSAIEVTAHQADVYIAVSVSASGRGNSLEEPSPFQLKLPRIGLRDNGQAAGGITSHLPFPRVLWRLMGAGYRLIGTKTGSPSVSLCRHPWRNRCSGYGAATGERQGQNFGAIDNGRQGAHTRRRRGPEDRWGQPAAYFRVPATRQPQAWTLATWTAWLLMRRPISFYWTCSRPGRRASSWCTASRTGTACR